MNKKPLGKISFGYYDLIMPLEVAHKIQALLAEHATKVDNIYGAKAGTKSLNVMVDYDVSAVQVWKEEIDFDARGIDSTSYSKWQDSIRQREPGGSVMSPQDFAKLRGE